MLIWDTPHRWRMQWPPLPKNGSPLGRVCQSVNTSPYQTLPGVCYPLHRTANISVYICLIRFLYTVTRHLITCSKHRPGIESSNYFLISGQTPFHKSPVWLDQVNLNLWSQRRDTDKRAIKENPEILKMSFIRAGVKDPGEREEAHKARAILNSEVN